MKKDNNFYLLNIQPYSYYLDNPDIPNEIKKNIRKSLDYIQKTHMEEGGEIPQSAIEEGKKVELEHAHTIEEIKDNPNISVEDAAELIAKDHLAESPDYYEKLKIVESQFPLSRIEDTENKNTQTCNCPTMKYHNELTETQIEKLGDKYIAEGTTIKDLKTGSVSDIVEVVHNGFMLLPQSGLDNAPRTPFFVPFQEIIDKHGRQLIEIGGYENTAPDHNMLILVVKDIMARNIIKGQMEKMDNMEEFVEEPVELTAEMAEGGIIGEIKANRSGAIREVRDVNGKILKQVYVGNTLYKKRPGYRAYFNNENEVLGRHDAGRIHMAYGGIVGVETLPNFYRVDIASPKNVSTCRVPKWAQNVAESVTPGAKVTTCKKYKKWFLSSVLIPKDGMTPSHAEHLASEIKNKIEHKKMENGGVMWETGATSHKVNNLILFADNTGNLAEMRDAIYSTIKSRSEKSGGKPSKEEIENRFKTFLLKVKGQYIREMGNTREARKEATLTPAEDKDFLRVYAEGAEERFYGGGQMAEIDYDKIRALKYWDGLKANQKLHFLLDHADYVFEKTLKDISAKELREYKKLASASWNSLPKEVQMALEEHVIMGTYENGGELQGYTSSNNSNKEFIGDDIDSTVKGILVLIDSTDDEDEKERLREELKKYDHQPN